VARLVRLAGLWMLDLARAEGTTSRDLARVATGVLRGRCAATTTTALSTWDVEDVELTARSGFGGEFLGWVMADVVAVDNVVVPVS
jgi:hypothetical protein